jgi:hypothetical protein
MDYLRGKEGRENVFEVLEMPERGSDFPIELSKFVCTDHR